MLAGPLTNPTAALSSSERSGGFSEFRTHPALVLPLTRLLTAVCSLGGVNIVSVFSTGQPYLLWVIYV